eukprot:TRINITY_DN10430_c0_g1_i2.p1 TRINITY_DN10430_c0_g1~~TRINITY_DN10430_c0_g1_i2.p1  ORF type:complete len:294 (-),score=82.52 TRINITY_DN10430_c0_g1_i2:756-1637(-)
MSTTNVGIMKNSEFIVLLTANTNKTNYLRTYSKHWPSGARRVPDSMLFQIGRVISLLVSNPEQGKICPGCKDKKECLMVYNFQPLHSHQGELFCALDMVVKPIAEIDNTTDLIGRPLQLIINMHTTEVMNNSKGMKNMGMLDEQDIIEDEDLEPPVSYGFFKDYLTVGSFLAIGTNDKICSDDVFSGKLDHSELIQQCVSYDSFVEAREVMAAAGYQIHLIGEMNGPKENLPAAKLKGVSKLIVKIIDPLNPKVEVTPNPHVEQEANVEDQVERLEESFKEQKVEENEAWPMD